MFPVLLVCLTYVLSPCVAQRSWNITLFPDPITHPSLCGREQSSFICDPNKVLPVLKANMIDGVLKSIYNETSVPCYSTDPKAVRRKGYLVMLAAIPKMDKYHTKNMEDSLYSSYKEARFFSYHLGNIRKWGKHSSGCNEMVIIFYSSEDGVLYTSTQPVARRVLTDAIIRDNTMAMLTRFYPLSKNEERASEAILYLANKYSDTLRKAVVEPTTKP